MNHRGNKMKIRKNKYFGIVCQLTDVRPHPNADRLSVAMALGYEIIVAKSAKDGDIGIVFPEGGQLSKEMGLNNDLYRKHPETGKPMGGFFERDLRIRPVKLRGVKSEAFFTSLESLSWAGDYSPKVGDEISELNGNLICKRYYNKATRIAMKKVANVYKKPWWLPSFLAPWHKENALNKIGHDPCPDFAKHFDTGKVRQNLHAIPEGKVIVTVKAHGCVPHCTAITMADGKTKPISKIVVGDMVSGVDIKTGEVVPTKVTKLFRNGPTDNWKIIEKSNNYGKLGTNYQKLICTENHKVFTSEGYVKAEELSEGDEIYVSREVFDIDLARSQMLRGKLLGDGYIDTSAKSYSVVYGHKEDHKVYLDYCSAFLGELSTGTFRSRVSGYGTKMMDARTKHCFSINDLVSEFYENGERVRVPKDLKITPELLAFWYMDDGSLGHNESQKDRANIACCSFSDQDASRIKPKLTEAGFDNFKLYKDSRGFWRLRFNHSDAFKLFDKIKNYVPEIMQYKLAPEFRGKTPILPKNKICKTIKYYPEKVVSIEDKKPDRHIRPTKYDIETGTHNYFASSILVHNSSQRFGYVKYDDRNWISRLLRRPVNYKHITGTRNVVKNPNTFGKMPDNGYYKGTDFRYEIHKKLKSVGLSRGEVLYFEVLGWASDSTTIMPDHKISWKDFKDAGFSKEEFAEIQDKYGEKFTYHYGNLQGNFSIQVYRIVQDGKDISWKDMVKRCEQLRLNTVKFVEEIDSPEDPKDLMDICRKHAEVDDDGQLREGVVLRFEDTEGNLLKMLKFKSFRFCVAENIKTNEINLEEIS